MLIVDIGFGGCCVLPVSRQWSVQAYNDLDDYRRCTWILRYVCVCVDCFQLNELMFGIMTKMKRRREPHTRKHTHTSSTTAKGGKCNGKNIEIVELINIIRVQRIFFPLHIKLFFFVFRSLRNEREREQA